MRGWAMFARQIAIASLLSFALLSLLGSVLPASSGPLDYCRADAERLCPGVPMGGGRIVGWLRRTRWKSASAAPRRSSTSRRKWANERRSKAAAEEGWGEP